MLPKLFAVPRPILCLAFAWLQLAAQLSSPAPIAAQDLTDFHLAWIWSVPGANIGSAGLFVVDFDGDGDAEVLATSRALGAGGYWNLFERRGSELVTTYSSLPFEDGIVSLSSARVGARSFLVVTGHSSIQLFDGASRSPFASFPLLSSEPRAAAAADFDQDGTLDLAVCHDDDLYVYELSAGSARVKYGFGCSSVLIGQTDGDPQLEIALSGNPTGGFLLDGAKLTVDWADVRGFGSHFALGDFDADGRDEVASVIENDAGVRVQDPETGALLWQNSSTSVEGVAAGFFDAEPGAELVVALGPSGALHLLDGVSPAEIRVIASPAPIAGALAVGDADSDGVADILWSAGDWGTTGERLYLASSPSVAPSATSRALRGPFRGLEVGDFQGGGTIELATSSTFSHGDQGGVAMIFSLENGSLLRSAALPLPETPGEGYVSSLDSGQLDGDLQLELCLGANVAIRCMDGADFTAQWTALLPSDTLTTVLRLAQIDGDPVPEVLAGAGRRILAFEGENGLPKWTGPYVAPDTARISQVDMAELDGDASPEIVVGSSGWGAYIAVSDDAGSGVAGPLISAHSSMLTLPGEGGNPSVVWISRFDNGSILPFDPLTGLEGPVLTTLGGAATAFSFADVNRDGLSDVVAVLGMKLQVEDGSTGQIIWESPYLEPAYNVAEPLLVGDFDHDSVPEILLATRDGVLKFEAPLLAIFVDGFESGDTSSW